MNSYIFLVDGLIILFTAVFLRHTLYRMRFFLHMFQQLGYKTNEYRTWVNQHFFSKTVTPEHLLFNLVVLILVYFIAGHITTTAGALVITVFVLFWFFSVARYRSDKEKKPLVFTARFKRVGGTLLVIISGLWYLLITFAYSGVHFREFPASLLQSDPYFLSFGLILVDMLVPLFVYISAWLMKPVEKTIQNGFKRQARKKLASLPHLKVIAITGSYGKTSTKFAIESFLKERVRVCVTPGSYNTPMGICKVINNELEASHQVLILEMGARYKGNIRELCNIARPDIAVITNVGVSHLETFGSREAVAEEKSTLAKELKPGGTLILNGDDSYVRQMANLREDVNIRFTGAYGTVQAVEAELGAGGTSFTMRWLNEEGNEEQAERITTRLLGAHNIQNILLASAVARDFSIRLKTIAVAASEMDPVEHRLELKDRNGITVIDDAFNSNPVGAKNAVDILASFKSGRKILITPGMIELGELEEVENRQFGEHIGRSGIDLVILVGKEQTLPIFEGIQSAFAADGKNPEVRIADSLFEANDILSEFAAEGDVVLYENDLPDTYNE